MDIAVVLVPALLVLLAFVALLSWVGSVVPVDDELRLPVERHAVERSTFGPLGTIPRCRMVQAVPGQVTLQSSRIPTWALVVGVLTLPIGVVLLAFVREHALLHVRYSEVPGGTLLQVAGTARRGVALDVGRVLGDVALELVPVR